MDGVRGWGVGDGGWGLGGEAASVRPGNRSLLFKLFHSVLSHTKENTSLLFAHFRE